MKKIISLALVIVMALVLAIPNMGCASYMVMKESGKQVAMKKALMSNNQMAMKSLQLGSTADAAGVPVSWLEALSERPWMQAGAAGIDALVGWGAYQGVKAIDSSNSGSGSGTTANQNSSGQNTTIIQGNGNNVTVSGSTPPATTPSL